MSRVPSAPAAAAADLWLALYCELRDAGCYSLFLLGSDYEEYFYAV
jgi:hypothetical protein